MSGIWKAGGDASSVQEMEDVFATGTIVWASAKRDIFWPAEVVEPESEDQVKGLVAAVHFLVEDSYENIRSQKKIFPWNCCNQDKFIHKGRALKNDERRIEFNKALAEADREVAGRSEDVAANQDKRKLVKLWAESVEDSSSLQDTSMFCSNNEKNISTGDITSKNSWESGRSSNEEKGEMTSKQTVLATPRKRWKSSHAGVCYNEVGKELTAKSPVKNVSKVDRLFKESPGAKSFKRNVPEEKCVECAFSTKSKKRKVNSWNRRTREQYCSLKEQTDNSNSMKEDLLQESVNFGVERPCGTITLDTEPCHPSHCGATCSDNNENRTGDGEGNERREKHCMKGTKETKKTSRDTDTSVETSAVKETKSAMPIKSGFSQKPLLKQKQANGQKNSINATGDTNASCSDESSDDELLVPFSPDQEISEFAVGDVVWAKYYREPHWPAQIKKLTGKRKSDRKFLVHFLGWNETLFPIQPRKLVHFACDPAQRAKFMSIQDVLKDSAEKNLFEEALNKAEDLVNRKGLGKSEQDDLAEGSVEIFNGESKVDDEPTPSNLKLFLERRKSTRLKKKVSKYKDILSYIRQAKPTLKQIHNGEKPCDRHRIFTSGTVREKDNLKRQAGFGPIGDDLLREAIMQLLLDYYKEVRGDAEPLGVRYVSDVWLPEAIIWSIQKIDHVNRTTAETFYRNGSEYAVTRPEVQELASQLKQRTLSEEEKEARLRKAKRTLEKRNYSF